METSKVLQATKLHGGGKTWEQGYSTYSATSVLVLVQKASLGYGARWKQFSNLLTGS